jgi:nucleoside-diphosphate-sugar epimerase
VAFEIIKQEGNVGPTTDRRRDKVLLTGGSGLVGSHVAALLSGRCQLTHFDAVDPGDGLPWIQGDLCDPGAVQAACEGQDVVIHVAGLHGARWQAAGDDAGFRVNVLGTQNVLGGAHKGGAWRVVYTSSIWATGHAPLPAPYLPIDERLPREPFELYGLTKKLGEQMCAFATQRYGLSTICLRPGGICPQEAPLQRRLNHLFGAVDVRDVAAAHVLALDAPDEMRHERFVIAAQSPLCAVDPAHFFADRAGVLERLYPGVGALLEQGKLTLDLPGQVEWYTIEKARSMLGYAPRYTFELPQEARR